MKKTWKLALCGLMLAGAMNAQVATLPESWNEGLGILPKVFSADEKTKLVTTEQLGEDGNLKVSIYNSSFNVEHSFEIAPQIRLSKTVYERRAAVATPGEFVTLRTENISVERLWNQASKEEKIEWLRKNHNYYLCDLLLQNQGYYIGYHEKDSIYTDTNGNVYIYLIGEGYDDSTGDRVEKTLGTCILNGNTLKLQSATSEEFAAIDTEDIVLYIPWSQASQEERIKCLKGNGRSILHDNNCYDYHWDRDSIHTDTNGDVYMYLIGYDYSMYDERVIGAFVLSGETLKIQPITYQRTGEWEVVDTDEYEYHDYMEEIWDMLNFDENLFYELEGDIIVTQTLFNTDEKYEYIRFKYTTYSDRFIGEDDYDGDGITDTRSFRSGYEYVGIEVVSEDGNVIASFDAGDTDGGDLIIWEGKRYLRFYDYSGEENAYKFYEINPNGSGITRASSAAFMHILPAMPKKNTSVTVEFGEESVKKGGQLMITDMNGRTVYRNAVAPGETSVRVPLRRMESGVYNVTLTNDGKKVETSKLIVR